MRNKQEKKVGVKLCGDELFFFFTELMVRASFEPKRRPTSNEHGRSGCGLDRNDHMTLSK